MHGALETAVHICLLYSRADIQEQITSPAEYGVLIAGNFYGDKILPFLHIEPNPQKKMIHVHFKHVSIYQLFANAFHKRFICKNVLFFSF